MRTMRYLLQCTVCVILLSLSLCKKTLQQGSTLPGKTGDATTAGQETSASLLDTVIIERDSTAIDVKAAEIAPEIIEPVKPVYSIEMIENEVEGSVRLKILVGSNGSVKEYILLNDLGYGTDKAIHSALLKTKFTAARKENRRISVWIETTINFKPPKI